MKEYRHCFEHGTCHLLPSAVDHSDPAWVQWRTNHPDQWQWRPREVDEHGYLVRDADGRVKRVGPWLNPDGTKHRWITADSPEGRKILDQLKRAHAAPESKF